MDAIKMLWEKIDRESEGTWRYEVFRDNIEKHLPKEEHICEKHLMDSNCPICGMFVAGEKHNEIMDRLIDKDEKIEIFIAFCFMLVIGFIIGFIVCAKFG